MNNVIEVLLLDLIEIYFKGNYNHLMELYDFLYMTEDEYSIFVKTDVIPKETIEYIIGYYFTDDVKEYTIKELEKLRDCPFCGACNELEDKIDVVYPNKNKSLYFVNCSNYECGSSMSGLTKFEAIAKYNRRVTK